MERVDFISGPGFHEGSETSPPADVAEWEGPSLIVTPLCTMDFDPISRRARLATLHPGVTIDEARAATGFVLESRADLQETEPPSREDLAILRELDAHGFLRERVPA